MLTVSSLHKTYGTRPAIGEVSFAVEDGSFVCVVGPSGCGKTTMLRLVAGLDTPSTGAVAVDGRVALMFQEAALLPWRTAGGNVELALRLRGMRSRAERRRVACELLGAVHLDGFASRQPHQLSGGMRQRVALARAFAQDADILLMDEPFGALDAMTRDLLHHELEQLWLDRGFTVVFVTHNVREAAVLSDRVIVMTRAPGRLLEEQRIGAARPRDLDDVLVQRVISEIHTSLMKEVDEDASREMGR